MKHAKRDVDLVNDLVKAADGVGRSEMSEDGSGRAVEHAYKKQEAARERVLRIITRLRTEVRRYKTVKKIPPLEVTFDGEALDDENRRFNELADREEV